MSACVFFWFVVVHSPVLVSQTGQRDDILPVRPGELKGANVSFSSFSTNFGKEASEITEEERNERFSPAATIVETASILPPNSAL